MNNLKREIDQNVAQFATDKQQQQQHVKIVASAGLLRGLNKEYRNLIDNTIDNDFMDATTSNDQTLLFALTGVVAFFGLLLSLWWCYQSINCIRFAISDNRPSTCEPRRRPRPSPGQQDSSQDDDDDDDDQQQAPQETFRSRIVDFIMTKQNVKGFQTFEYDKAKANWDDNTCSICLGQFENGQSVISTVCSHPFHAECFKEWAKENDECPMCRGKMWNHQDIFHEIQKETANTKN